MTRAGALQPEPLEAIEVAQSLARRVAGSISERIEFRLSPSPGAGDSFTVSCRNGDAVVEGTSISALTAGFHQVVRKALGVRISRDRPLPVPMAGLSDFEPITLTSRAALRYSMNPCTFGYTTPFWTWDQWAREIDWMALQGINTPLHMVGHEAVWRKVLVSEGLSDAEADAFLGSPPYLPWNWLGCLDGWPSPLPAGVADRQAALGRLIADRERSLGMTPVLPGFAGHVPQAWTDGQARSLDWFGLRAWMLDPRSDRFREIASRLAEEQELLLGATTLYLADPFIEAVPPTADLDDLADVGAAVYNGITRGDRSRRWVLQAWPFLYQAAYWDRPHREALLARVPREGCILLDLWADHHPLWSETDEFDGRPFVWCALNNFGGRPGLYGNLPAARTGLLDAGTREGSVGIGLSMEALDSNVVVNDYVLDAIWSDPVEAVQVWLERWVDERYGELATAEAHEAWRLLLAGAYSDPAPGPRWSAVLSRPDRVFATTDRGPIYPLDASRLPARSAVGAWRLLLVPARSQKTTPLDASPFVHDLIDVAQQAICELFDWLVTEAPESVTADGSSSDRATVAAQLLEDLDDLLGGRAEYRLVDWLLAARAAGGTTASGAQTIERAARLLLSSWLGRDGELYDYAGRHWSGLVRDLYAPRWARYFEVRAAGLPMETIRTQLIALDREWVERTDLPAAPLAGSVVAIAEVLFTRYSGLMDAAGLTEAPE